MSARLPDFSAQVHRPTLQDPDAPLRVLVLEHARLRASLASLPSADEEPEALRALALIFREVCNTPARSHSGLMAKARLLVDEKHLGAVDLLRTDLQDEDRLTLSLCADVLWSNMRIWETLAPHLPAT